MTFLILKSLHLVGLISWFAGLFYIVRLFIYFVEANEKPQSDKKILQDQFLIMQRRLWKGITVPAMVITALTGTTMLILMPGFMSQGWMHLKLFFLVFLFAYHFKCGQIFKKISAGTYAGSSKNLRIFNEIATLLLFAIIFAVILKNISAALTSFAVVLVLGIVLFKITSLLMNRKQKS